jgi:hypothetical protein
VLLVEVPADAGYGVCDCLVAAGLYPVLAALALEVAVEDIDAAEGSCDLSELVLVLREPLGVGAVLVGSHLVLSPKFGLGSTNAPRSPREGSCAST